MVATDLVSVVGFDDFRLSAEALYLCLTTVSLPYREIGALSARYALDGVPEALIVRVPCLPAQRGTVAPLAVGRA